MTAAAQATAVIAAAGSGERLGAGKPKALVAVGGRELVAWSLDAFAGADSIGAVVVAAPPGHEAEVERLAPPGLELYVLAGGASRADSVRAALAAVKTELVAIHDAARPLVSPSLIDAVVGGLGGRPDAAGVIAATPITDTVKRAHETRPPTGDFERGGPEIVRTESRDHLWAAQTPQAFRAEALRDAFAAGPGRAAGGTDEARVGA
ncbi:MAG: IspD/TarI family cytidylyltransferase, partial [Solirubrobacterales bacterium]